MVVSVSQRLVQGRNETYCREAKESPMEGRGLIRQGECRATGCGDGEPEDPERPLVSAFRCSGKIALAPGAEGASVLEASRDPA